MYFNSGYFVFFLVCVFVIYWKVPHPFTKYILFVAVLIYASSFGLHCLVWALIISIIGFYGGIIIEKSSKKRTTFLIIFIFSILIPLAGMKYLPLFSIDLKYLFIPIGMSFYSFRNISYLIDVYRGTIRSYNNFVIYVNYSLFFPSFSSGPIDRANDLIPQLSYRTQYDDKMIFSGLLQFMWGLFKKIVVAAHMNVYTNWIFGDIFSYSGGTLVFASVLYSIQLYCDFSGYSDMAIGIAKMFGIRIHRNFENPYFATSVTDFWHRWHISLSTWLRDYVFIPLGGNRCSKKRMYCNIFITFLISGIWHGVTINYLIWGALHGIISIFEKIMIKKKHLSFYLIRMLITFIIVNFLWVVFRLQCMDEIIYFFMHMMDGIIYPFDYIKKIHLTLNIDFLLFIKLLLISLVVFTFEKANEKKNFFDEISGKTRMIRILVCASFGYIMFMLLPVNSAVDYIYFRF